MVGSPACRRQFEFRPLPDFHSGYFHAGRGRSFDRPPYVTRPEGIRAAAAHERRGFMVRHDAGHWHPSQLKENEASEEKEKQLEFPF
jgi:hypothetical protein